MSQLSIATDQDLSLAIQPGSTPPIIYSSSQSEKIAIGSKTEFSIVFNEKRYESSDFEISGTREYNDNSGKRIARYFHNHGMDVASVYQVLAGKPYLKKWLEITFHNPGILEKIAYGSYCIPEKANVKIAKSSGGFDICLFLSADRSGLFFTLDFPYSDIAINDGHFGISYPPYQSIDAGETIRSHVMTIGNYSLQRANEEIGFDPGQAEAFRNYLLFDYAIPHLQAPQLVYSSIVNKYTEVSFNVPDTPKGKLPVKNKIFYTLTNAPYLMLYPERIPDEIDFCREVSMDFCQIYEGPFEWTDETPDENTLVDISGYAQKAGIKLGLYTGANNLTAPHFNHYGEQKGDPEWRMVDANGNVSSTYCFGSDDFTRWFTDTIIQASQKYGFLMTNFDFLTIAPCYAKNHNHPPGGIYQQVSNVRKCLNDIRSAVSGYVFDSNLGWAPLVPKIASEMDGFYLTDPYVNTYFPSLNATKILDDSRRADTVKYFRDYLTPVEYFRNCEYFVCADSVIHDSSMFEYGILQGLAVTPNLQLGESRALFDRLNSKQCEHARQFLAKWTQFVKENWEYYHYTKILTNLPSVGQVEIYAHCKNDRGYVFIVNPNPFSLSAQFKLDDTIGLSSSGNFIVEELYPEENCLVGLAHNGDNIQYTVESQSCVVLSIKPDPYNDRIRLFGLPARLKHVSEGYQTTLSYFQGRHRQIFLQLPSDEVITAIYSDEKEIPFRHENGLYSFDVTFPKERVEPELRHWVICENTLDYGLNQNFHLGIEGDKISFPVLEYLSGNSNSLPATFLGAFIENLLNERYTALLNIQTLKKSDIKPEQCHSFSAQNVELYDASLSEEQKSLFHKGCNELWFSSKFEVPFIQRYIPPDYYHHNFIMLNFLRPDQIKEIRAWINGAEAEVHHYNYWRGGEGSFTYYLDGTRSSLQSGKNTLVMWVKSL